MSKNRKGVKPVLLRHEHLQMKVDDKFWKATVRAAIGMGYLPRHARHMSKFPANHAHGLALFLEDNLRMPSHLPEQADKSEDEPWANEAFALIGFCMIGEFSIILSEETQRSLTRPVKSLVN